MDYENVNANGKIVADIYYFYVRYINKSKIFLNHFFKCIIICFKKFCKSYMYGHFKHNYYDSHYD
jgi:hypothetical protein